jgi:hypothetical protein
MIPIDSGNLRDLLIAGVIVASLYGLIRVSHDHDEVWPGVEIHQHLKMGGNGGRIDGRLLHLAPSRSRSSPESVVFSHLKFRSERRHW